MLRSGYNQGGMASQNPSRYASDNRGRATFPILFKKVLTVLGTLHPSAGEHSAGNWDDEVSFTNSSVTFEHFTHYYIAFGI